jgi:predicted Zn-ribbon and HTH transcriptional regulator
VKDLFAWYLYRWFGFGEKPPHYCRKCGHHEDSHTTSPPGCVRCKCRFRPEDVERFGVRG